MLILTLSRATAGETERKMRTRSARLPVLHAWKQDGHWYTDELGEGEVSKWEEAMFEFHRKKEEET